MPIIKDYETLQDLAMQAIHDYLQEVDPKNNRTSLGIMRAKKMLAYFECNKDVQQPEAIRNMNILAITFALFGQRDAGFLGIVFGRSVELASKMTDLFFEGSYSLGPRLEMKDTLTSKVFSKQALSSAKHDMGNQYVVSYAGRCWQFIKLKGVRFLLESAVSTDLQEDYYPIFQKTVRDIKL